MRKGFQHKLVSIFFILSAWTAGAQKPASLPKASEFVIDSLAPDLMSYMVRAPFPSSRLEIALAAFEPLADTQYQYLAKLERSRDGIVPDSTLNSLLKELSEVSGKRALILCGDIDINRTRDSLKAFSARMTKNDSLGTTMRGRALPADSRAHGPLIEKSSCSIVMSTPRLSREDMGSTVARVSARYAHWLGDEYVRRAGRALYDAGIPCGGVSYDYYPSGSHGGDETIVVRASVADSDTERAEQIMRLCLLGIADGGFRNWPPSDTPADTRSSMERCKDAFLYGADLASDAAVAEWFDNHYIKKDSEIEFFKAFAREYVSELRHAAANYDNQWFSRIPGINEKPDMTDTARLNLPISKSRVRKDNVDKMTGGTLWVFDNGIKVIYKEMDTGGCMEYSMIFNGGATEFLSVEEIGLVGDVVASSRICGMEGPVFMSLLNAWGVTMDISAGVSETILGGHVDDSDVEKILRAMNAVANSRRPASEAQFEALRKRLELSEQEFRRSTKGLETAMDSIICPDFVHATRAVAGNLKNDLPQRVDKYLKNCFERFDDGVLMLVGDIPADRVKRILTRHIGIFGTGGDPAPRSYVDWTPKSGSSETGHIDGCVTETGSVHVTITSATPYSHQRKIALEAAEAIIRDTLEQALSGSGYTLEINSRLDIRPVERLVMNIHCKPSTVVSRSPFDVHRIIEGVLDEASTIKERKLDAFKDSKTAEFQSGLKDAVTVIRAASARYGYGKDVIGSAAQIKSLRWEDVAKVMTAIQDGSRLVYTAD